MLHRGFRAAKKEGIDVDEEQVIYHLVSIAPSFAQGLQLYDLSEDPGEQKNLARWANASTDEVLSRLKEVAISHYRCASFLLSCKQE